MAQHCTRRAALKRRFVWTPGRRRAVALVFEDALRDEEIAAALGISRRQLARWKAHPAFDAAVKRMAERYWKAMLGG